MKNLNENRIKALMENRKWKAFIMELTVYGTRRLTRVTIHIIENKVHHMVEGDGDGGDGSECECVCAHAL